MRRTLESWAASLVSALVRLLPRRAALMLGAGLGRALAALDARHVAIACDNLRRAFPAWDEERVGRTARAVYVHFGRVLFDILWMQGRTSTQILPLVEFDGVENAEAAMATKRGILYCTAHLGNWEIHAIAHAWVHRPITAVARPLDNPALDARLCAFRMSSGNTVIYKKKALAQMVRALRAGEGVAVLLDQNVQAKDGIFVEFFGRPAATTTVAAALAAKTGCALVPVHTELLPDGRYRLSYDPPVLWTPSGDRAVDIAGITQELARRTEDWIRRTPEQWLWMHRRWKTRPPGEGAQR
jgi:Kdo2-lipid IVA lauroyltransferase/acyltransferase